VKWDQEFIDRGCLAAQLKRNEKIILLLIHSGSTIERKSNTEKDNTVHGSHTFDFFPQPYHHQRAGFLKEARRSRKVRP
jgi:hypothetical protein